jgi:hypothetical protein
MTNKKNGTALAHRIRQKLEALINSNIYFSKEVSPWQRKARYRVLNPCPVVRKSVYGWKPELLTTSCVTTTTTVTSALLIRP